MELPRYFINHTEHLPDVYIKKYESKTNSTREKISLTHHLISFIIEGKKELIHNNTSQSVPEKHYILAKSGNCLMTERCSTNEKYSSFLIFISDSFLDKLSNKYNTKIDFSKEYNYSNDFITLTFDDFIKYYLESFQEIISKKETSKEIIEFKTEELLLYLANNKKINLYQLFQVQKNRQFKKSIENNIFSELKLEEIAFLCHMSLSTFKRTFFKIYNTTPSRWIQEQKLEKSAYSLRYENKNPTEIYYEYGYKSLSSFTQSFKKKYGVTPKKYKTR
ncbi:helix-turn-helix domain-containing protein [Flavobacterium sp.]|uniref:helix-turn-helix domain-containing protein n=2 Tax=Flavobacterium sp. TaxID=239 RepID=UPI00404759BE